MSFAFLPLYTGDYLRDTRHLTPLKHGVYLLLLMHCWDQRGPLPLDEQECAGIANCRSADEVEALRYVLRRYFIEMDDGWYNKRMQEETERAHLISLARSAAGKSGAKARTKTYKSKAKQLLSKREARESTPTTTTPTTTTPTSTPRKPPANHPSSQSEKTGVITPSAQGAQFEPPDRVSASLWGSYLRHRRLKRAKMTDDAYALICRELAKMADPNAAIQRSIMNGWTGVFDRAEPSRQDARGAIEKWVSEQEAAEQPEEKEVRDEGD
jgi:uncharacterized protein YdaU (DUF1376 family)